MRMSMMQRIMQIEEDNSLRNPKLLIRATANFVENVLHFLSHISNLPTIKYRVERRVRKQES